MKILFFYEINFKQEPMNDEEERMLYIEENYYNRLQMLPQKIVLRENQYVVFHDSINFISSYVTNNQKTDVILPSDRTDILSYSDQYSKKTREKIHYKLDFPVEALKVHPLRIHYENNNPIVVFNTAHKIFEVSHWGNIAIEERYQIENVGAKLDGEFGRVDYDGGRNGGKNSLRKLKAKLPLRSNNLWYRDEIGNISTSRASRNWEDVNLELTPRFPILGGWKANFNIGYNFPTKFAVAIDDRDRFVLNSSFGMPFSDMLAKNYTVSVALPEGAQIAEITLPVDSKYTVTHEKYYSFLDLFGRPLVVINMKNAYDIHNIYFQITYTYSSFWLFVKPFIMISFFLSLFAFLIIYSRMDISLSREMKYEKIE